MRDIWLVCGKFGVSDLMFEVVTLIYGHNVVAGIPYCHVGSILNFRTRTPNNCFDFPDYEIQLYLEII
jgi:hypothetical protein